MSIELNDSGVLGRVETLGTRSQLAPRERDIRRTSARRAAGRRRPGDAAPSLTRLRAEGPTKANTGAWELRAVLVALDVAGMLVAWLPLLALFGGAHAPSVLGAAAIMTVVGLIAISRQRLYLARVCAARSVEVRGLGRAAAACGLVLTVLGPQIGLYASVARIAVGCVAMFLVLCGLRGAYSGWLRASRIRGRRLRPVLVVGANDEAEELVRVISEHPEHGFGACGVVGAGRGWAARDTGVPLMGGLHDAVAVARAAGATGVTVAVSAIPAAALGPTLRVLLDEGLHVQLSTGLTGVARHRLRVTPLSRESLLYIERAAVASWQHLAKRVLDVVVATGVLVLAAPALALVALAIKLEDGGPIIYRQERVGRHGRRFAVCKLRTMVPDASRQVDVLAALNERDGPLFKLEHDPRVTRIGRFLRSTSFDELPQLFNVLRGDMSLVGPRPALPCEVEQFDAELLRRHAVLPGITGLWQVEARDNPSFHAYRRLDLLYVENWSLGMDVAILVGTVRVVLSRAARIILSRSQPVAPELPVELEAELVRNV